MRNIPPRLGPGSRSANQTSDCRQPAKMATQVSRATAKRATGVTHLTLLVSNRKNRYHFVWRQQKGKEVPRAAAKRTTGAEQNCTTGAMPHDHGLAGRAWGSRLDSWAVAGVGGELIGGGPVRRWR